MVQVLALVAGSAGFIRLVHGWKTVCALIAVTSLHPEAAPVSLNALAAVARPSVLSSVAFTPVLEAVVSCVERNAKVHTPVPCEAAPDMGNRLAGSQQCHGYPAGCKPC
jgi:hypothetical protein